MLHLKKIWPCLGWCTHFGNHGVFLLDSSWLWNFWVVWQGKKRTKNLELIKMLGKSSKNLLPHGGNEWWFTIVESKKKLNLNKQNNINWRWCLSYNTVWNTPPSIPEIAPIHTPKIGKPFLKGQFPQLPKASLHVQCPRGVSWIYPPTQDVRGKWRSRLGMPQQKCHVMLVVISNLKRGVQSKDIQGFH